VFNRVCCFFHFSLGDNISSISSSQQELAPQRHTSSSAPTTSSDPSFAHPHPSHRPHHFSSPPQHAAHRSTSSDLQCGRKRSRADVFRDEESVADAPRERVTSPPSRRRQVEEADSPSSSGRVPDAPCVNSFICEKLSVDKLAESSDGSQRSGGTVDSGRAWSPNFGVRRPPLPPPPISLPSAVSAAGAAAMATMFPWFLAAAAAPSALLAGAPGSKWDLPPNGAAVAALADLFYRAQQHSSASALAGGGVPPAYPLNAVPPGSGAAMYWASTPGLSPFAAQRHTPQVDWCCPSVDIQRSQQPESSWWRWSADHSTAVDDDCRSNLVDPRRRSPKDTDRAASESSESPDGAQSLNNADRRDDEDYDGDDGPTTTASDSISKRASSSLPPEQRSKFAEPTLSGSNSNGRGKRASASIVAGFRGGLENMERMIHELGGAHSSTDAAAALSTASPDDVTRRK
jgi:hypothetical protein